MTRLIARFANQGRLARALACLMGGRAACRALSFVSRLLRGRLIATLLGARLARRRTFAYFCYRSGLVRSIQRFLLRIGCFIEGRFFA